MSTSGSIYWVKVVDFPMGNYKYTILTGVSGITKAFISPNTNLLAVGGSTDNRVFLIDLVSKSVLFTFTLNGTDTRAITWNADNSKIYVATGT